MLPINLPSNTHQTNRANENCWKCLRQNYKMCYQKSTKINKAKIANID